MKKLLIVLGILVIALTVGYAYAAEKEMDMSVQNGITWVAPAPLATPSEGPALALDNGITVFDSGVVSEKTAIGSAAGGMGEETRPVEFYNGITVFDTGPEK